MSRVTAPSFFVLLTYFKTFWIKFVLHFCLCLCFTWMLWYQHCNKPKKRQVFNKKDNSVPMIWHLTDNAMKCFGLKFFQNVYIETRPIVIHSSSFLLYIEITTVERVKLLCLFGEKACRNSTLSDYFWCCVLRIFFFDECYIWNVISFLDVFLSPLKWNFNAFISDLVAYQTFEI